MTRPIKRIYVAGPMTGLPEFNYPAFHREAMRLRGLNYEVENPAENPVPPCGTWLGYMRMAVRQVSTVDAIALLPGWIKSRGARTEALLALCLGLKIVRAGSIQHGPGVTHA